MRMANNGKDIKHTRHIESIMHFVRNGKKSKMHKIAWCDVVLKFAVIATKYVGEHDLTPIMKDTMVRLDNWDRKPVPEGLHNR